MVPSELKFLPRVTIEPASEPSSTLCRLLLLSGSPRARESRAASFDNSSARVFVIAGFDLAIQRLGEFEDPTQPPHPSSATVSDHARASSTRSLSGRGRRVTISFGQTCQKWGSSSSQWRRISVAFRLPVWAACSRTRFKSSSSQ